MEVWDAVPEPVQATLPARRHSDRHRPAARATGRRSERVRVAAGTVDTCAQAREYRDAAERRAGLARDYDLLSALQRRVYDACR